MPHPATALSQTPPALAALEAQVRRDLASIEVPLRPWVPERRMASGEILTDVVIVGAGLSGLAIAFGLMRQGVTRLRVLDAAPVGREGPWVTSARMRTLRSPKTLSGPDLGVPSLTYRAWHEAMFGAADWDNLDKIDRCTWMDYLVWFRDVVGITVSNDTRLCSITPADDHIALTLETPDGLAVLGCRKVVLATGIEGAGGLHVPPLIAKSLPRERWTHSGELLDLDRLTGKSVGVIGAAASSFDWAVAALDAGAAQVTMLARSAALPQTEILDWSNFPGFLNHFADLDDALRYQFARRMFAFKTPPTMEMYTRATASPAFRFVGGAALESAAMDGDSIALTAGGQSYRFDHLLLGTGYAVDISQRRELTGLIDSIALWSDRFTPPADSIDRDLLAYPYLGPAFEFTEKAPGTAPFLRDIHIFNNGAVPSLGPVCNGITGLKSGVPKLVSGVTRGLFLADAALHYRSLDGYAKVHFDPAAAGLA